MARRPAEAIVAAVDRPLRPAAAKRGVKIGTLDVYLPALLRPEPVRWRLALAAAHGDGGDDRAAAAPARWWWRRPTTASATRRSSRAGFRPLGAQMLRVDLVERLARLAHDGRGATAARRARSRPIRRWRPRSGCGRRASRS